VIARRYRHPASSEAGVAAIEFALIAPIFLILMFGIVIYGFYFGTRIAVAHAAAEGARAAVAGLTAGERSSFAEAQVRTVFARYAPLLTDDPAHLHVVSGPSAEAGLFEVTVRYDLSDRNFGRFAGFLPLPSSQPEVTVVTANGGF
jgi:Flp pilus assembly protein TadG